MDTGLDTSLHITLQQELSTPIRIAASVVLYQSKEEDILAIVNSFAGVPGDNRLYLVDNSPQATTRYNGLKNVEYIPTNANIGYGAGHNVALRKSLKESYRYHFVINPDIVFAPEAIIDICRYLDDHPEIGLLMPKVLYPNGDIQYVCKLLPSPADFFAKRFLPRLYSRSQQDRFEMRMSGYNKVMDVPFLSGCFMAFRREALEECGLFDERYFMYAEDIDLTRRIHQKFRTVFYPKVSIVHGYEAASYKSIRMFLILFVNIGRYFNKWGWVFDRDRRNVNAKVLHSLRKPTVTAIAAKRQ